MRRVLEPVLAWRHDLAGCLHACAGTLLAWHGLQPLEVLGASWRFYYPPGDVRREEYYFPVRPQSSLLAALAPYHPVRSRWHTPPSAEQGWAEVRRQVAGGTPVAVAVDNFHLPFRPAYRDVHSNHLVVVHGFDDRARTVRVLDSIPPYFEGDIALDVLACARGSDTRPAHERDLFFTGSEIAHRWLEVEVAGDAPALDRALAARVIRGNVEALRCPVPSGAYEGLAGQGEFLGDMAEHLRAGKDVADELFVVAGAALATTALHADWLGLVAERFDEPVLAELGRHVQRVAHHWTAVRIMAALSRSGEVTAGQLHRRARALRQDQEWVLCELDEAGGLL